MSSPSLATLSREAYERLLRHASRAEDFAYIGSEGAGNARGKMRGFTALAQQHLQLNDLAQAPVDSIASKMTEPMEKYAIAETRSGNYLLGGWYGVLAYEFGLQRESKLSGLGKEMAFPVLFAGFYLWAASYDAESDTCYLWIHPDCPQHTRDTLTDWMSRDDGDEHPRWQIVNRFTPSQTKASFIDNVATVHHYIHAGDCYQANLSQEFSARYTGEPWAAFQSLAEAYATPYSAFIRVGRHSVLSLSPERFFEIQGRTISTSPIKGTRPRGGTEEQDNAYAEELQASEKDRAENLMIVDLLRNDLSVNAKVGSVQVEKLFALESYRNVHHLVSHIRADLADDVSPIKALMDAFPGGSITGAPKIRAMEIIDELEPHWRGPYCGSVFYWGLDGSLDSNIAIRTMLCNGEGTIRCWGGGGIVADSDPESEYQETLTKVKPLMDFLENL
ncbi:aminodeoxychorismate synthase component I [Marinobacter sp.]|uniref:aminodeoxychorismate synthase component I n=1 Tax=Marinobacter sp. TaxID=50741 RepID=UPI002352DDB3|nr:aminodeoxychorismate synthase component I [Marinobacter sp.]